MTEKDRHIQSLIREFKNNELQYEDQICGLIARNKILELEIQELKTFINIYRTKQSESIEREVVMSRIEDISKKVLSLTESHYHTIIQTMSQKINCLTGKLIDCERSIQVIKQCGGMIAIQELKKSLSYKNNYIKSQGELIDKIINEKSESEILFNRQFIFLQRLANDKKQLCNRLSEINHYLMQQNTELKKMKDLSKKSSACKFVIYQDHQQINAESHNNLDSIMGIKDSIKDVIMLNLKGEERKESKVNSLASSKTKISLHIDRKQLGARSKQRQNQNSIPFSDIQNEIDFSKTYK